MTTPPLVCGDSCVLFVCTLSMTGKSTLYKRRGHFILSVMNLIDRFWVDGYWVGHTNAWEIPGTEDLKPYITAKDKGKKWLFGTIGMAVISAALAAIMMLFIKI